MSGRKISDHSFWGGGMSKESVLAHGVKNKMESSAETEGELRNYQDTSEKIRAAQDDNASRIRKKEQPAMRRN